MLKGVKHLDSLDIDYFVQCAMFQFYISCFNKTHFRIYSHFIHIPPIFRGLKVIWLTNLILNLRTVCNLLKSRRAFTADTFLFAGLSEFSFVFNEMKSSSVGQKSGD